MLSKHYLAVVTAALCLCFCVACSTIRQQFHKSGIELVIQMDDEASKSNETAEKVVTVLNSRLNALGVSGEATRDQSQSELIKVSIYAASDLQRVTKILLQQSDFRLQAVVSPLNPSPLQIYPTRDAAAAAVKDTEEVLSLIDKRPSSESYLIVERSPVVSGSEVRDAGVNVTGQGSSEFQIYFSLKPQGAAELKEWSGKNIGHYLAIVLNKQVYSAPFVKSEIADSGVIDGRFTREAAENLALIMKSGEMPVSLKLISTKQFSN